MLNFFFLWVCIQTPMSMVESLLSYLIDWSLWDIYSSETFVPYCILAEVACSLTREEILQDWEWLHSNLMTTLTSFDTEEEITEFVCCKIQSIIANSIPDSQFADGRIINQYLNCRNDWYQCINWVLILFTEEDPESFKTVSFKFHQLFSVPKEDKLVNYYSCRSLNLLPTYVILYYIEYISGINCVLLSSSYWKSRLPRQGWLYLSVNHMCFYAYILARETKLIVRWTDITELSKTNSLIIPDSIRVVTRDNKEVFINSHSVLFLYWRMS